MNAVVEVDTNIFYWVADTSQWLIQPQLTINRARYRGPRESWKVNLEINQIGFDIHNLFNITSVYQTNFELHIQSLEFGLNIVTDASYSGANAPAPYYEAVGATNAGNILDGGDVFAQNDSIVYDGGTSIQSGTVTDLDGGGSIIAYDMPANLPGTTDQIRRIQDLLHIVKVLTYSTIAV